MGGIKNIIEGHVNELLDVNSQIAAPRLKICKRCGLYHQNTFMGWMECNSKLWLNPETNDTSIDAKDGYVKGCGCRILAKIRVAAESCPAGKW